MGRAVGEFGGNDEGVLRVGSGGARAGKRAFVRIAGGGKLVVRELDGVQFRAHGGDGFAVIRLDADVDIVSFDGARVVDGKFQVVLPKEVEWSGSGRVAGEFREEYTCVAVGDTAKRFSRILEACAGFWASMAGAPRRSVC